MFFQVQHRSKLKKQPGEAQLNLHYFRAAKNQSKCK